MHKLKMSHMQLTEKLKENALILLMVGTVSKMLLNMSLMNVKAHLIANSKLNKMNLIQKHILFHQVNLLLTVDKIWLDYKLLLNVNVIMTKEPQVNQKKLSFKD